VKKAFEHDVFLVEGVILVKIPIQASLGPYAFRAWRQTVHS